MKYLIPVFSVLFLGCSEAPEQTLFSLDEALNSITAEEYRDHVHFLSQDNLAGRYPGAAGYDSAASYIEQQVKTMGLSPGGIDGTYRQPIRFSEATLQPSNITVNLNGRELNHGTDYLMPAVHEDISFSGDVVFVGAGVDATELSYSDFEEIDVDGKVAMFVWRTLPEKFGSIERAVHSNLIGKRLREKGAIGTVSIVPPEVLSTMPWPLITWLVSRPSMRYESENNEPYRSGIMISYKTAEAWLHKDKKNLAEMVKQIKQGNSPSFETSLTLEVNATSRRESIVSDNVAAIVKGSDPTLKEEYLVLSAHLDHDGISNPVANDSIYNGTIDNASGSAALLVLADKFAKMRPKRSMMFLWVTAEERGLLGSEYFAKYPTIEASKIVANQNMDGVVNLIVGTRDVIAYGYEYSNLSQSVDYAVEKLGLIRSEDPRPEETFFVRSDQYSFVAEGIPAIWVTGGYQGLADSVDAGAVVDKWLVTRYHRPNDDMGQPLDFEAATTEIKYNLLIANHIVNEIDQVRWNTDGFLYQTFVLGKE